MDDTGLIDTKFDLAGFHFSYCLCNVHGHGPGFRIRHKTAWTENANCANYTATTADGPAGFNAQYAYATNGVPTSVTNLGTDTFYTPGPASHPHAIIGFGSNSYGYDADGQQIRATSGNDANGLLIVSIGRRASVPLQ